MMAFMIKIMHIVEIHIVIYFYNKFLITMTLLNYVSSYAYYTLKILTQ